VGVSLSTHGLEVHYGARRALSGLDMDATGPCSVAVIGPNGSGKSTLLGVIAGLVAPSAGSVVVEAASPPALVLQSTDVDRSLPITVHDTVAMARYPHLGLLRRFGPADRQAVADAMARMAVHDLADRQLHQLSGGQRQRVLVAQGLAQGSDILLLDEPVTGVDVTSRTTILEIIDEERAAGRLVIMTTHNLDDAHHCDLVLLLDTALVAFGPPADVLTDHHLHRAFGGRFIRLGDEVLLDDPHHHDH
jgi:ABC-type Mn2+/Zn2+ transport system ATPase subunit